MLGKVMSLKSRPKGFWSEFKIFFCHAIIFNFLSDLSGRGQTVKKVVTRTEVRTVRTIDGRVVQDEYDPGTEHTEIEQFSYGGKALNGEGPGTPTKRYAPGDEYPNGQRGPGSTSSVADYRSPRRGPAGSQSSVDDYRSPRGNPPRGGYSSADEGRMTPHKYGDTGYMSDSYTINKGNVYC